VNQSSLIRRHDSGAVEHPIALWHKRKRERTGTLQTYGA
jgi:hypothetical protein